MIEGLNEGSAFSFSDDRDSSEIELELASAGLSGYRWAKASSRGEDVTYLIERQTKLSVIKEGCCDCCGTQSKEQS